MDKSTLALERRFQSKLIKELDEMFHGEALIIKTDPDYIQGFPDLLILYEDTWAALECKRSSMAPHRPNQDYYVDRMNGMSFSRFIYPENKEEVLDALRRSFGV